MLAASCWLSGCGGGGGGTGGQPVQTPPASPPTVAAISPATGPLTGGLQVTLTGSGLTGATQVTFGATPGTGLKVLSDTSLTVFTPAGAGGVDTRVSTPAGQSSVVAADRFSYQSSPGNYAFNFAITSSKGAEVRGLAVDSGGNLYVSSQNQAKPVSKFDRFGNFVAQIGSSGSGPGQISEPLGLAVDAFDNLYVADNFRVEKFNSAGVFQSQTSINSTDFYPVEIAVDMSGNLYSAETDQRTMLGRLEKFDPTGKQLLQTSLPGYPLGIAVTGSGNIFVSTPQSFNSSQAALAELDSNGNPITSTISKGGEGIALDSSGNLYLTQGTQVVKYDSKGNLVTQFGSAGTGSGQFTDAGSIAVGASGNVYVLDHTTPDFGQSSRIEVFTPL